MVQRRGRARFLLEARDAIRRGQVGRQDFDRDRALQPRVLGTVHLPHAARAEERLQDVRPQSGAGRQWHDEADYFTSLLKMPLQRNVAMLNSRFIRGCVLGALSLLSAAGAAAQSRTTDVTQDVATLRAEVERLRAELQELRALVVENRAVMRRAPDEVAEPAPAEVDTPVDASVAALQQQPVDPQASLEMLRTQVAELAQIKVESASRMPIKVFGTIHTNVFANSAAPNWMDSPNLVNVPPADGHAGSFSATLRQTRVGLAIDGPTVKGVRSNATVAMDFFGGIPGFATGQVMGLPRLLVAFARFEGQRTAVEVGQDHMILAPADPTSLASLAFPALFRSGNLYLRTPQARVEHRFGSHVSVMGGIVAPIGGDVPGEDYRFVPPTLAGERSQRPGVQARVAVSAGDRETNRHADVGVSGHYGWEQRSSALVRSFASAIDFSVRRDLIGAAGELFVGENIDAFGGGAGLDARAQGGWAEIQFHPGARLSFAAGAGIDRLRGDPPPSLPRHRNRSAYGTTIFLLTPEIQASFEYHWLATQPGSGAERRNHHFDWVLAYKF